MALGTDNVSLQLLYAWFLRKAKFKALESLLDQGLSSNKDAITVTGNRGRMILTLGLDDLLAQGCEWAGTYLTNPSVEKRDRRLCDGIENSSSDR